MKTKIVAHRGESLAAPENTLESFVLAWQRGASCIEGDFHLTADNEIVCMHDDNTKRTCGVDKPIADQTLAELKSLDCGLWKGAQWKYTRIPTLLEVLNTLPPHGEIYIELKSVGPILDALQAVFARGPWRPEQLTFIAFDEMTIATVKRRFPAHNAYWLTCARQGVMISPEALAAKLIELAVDGVDIGDTALLQAEHVKAVHQAGKSFHAWTIDDADCARRLIDMQIDSLTCNRAYALQNELKGC